MTSLLNKLKTLAIGAMVVSFFMCTTLSSCNTNKKTENTEASEIEEHPTNTEEHPSDSTKQEHPKKEEHPKK